MENNQSTPIPANIKLRKHEENSLFFAYPDGGKFAQFSRPDGTVSTRLLVEFEQQLIRVELDLLLPDLSAREWAEKIFQATQDYPENIAPVQLALGNFEAWRLRRLFIEGGRDLLLHDAAFIQYHQNVYRLQYYARPEVFEQGRWVFETILSTLQFKEDSDG